MSIALMTLAWQMDMQAGRKMVLLALCDSANDEGKCWPSIDSLMQKCSMGERTVQQHVAAMEEGEILKRDMRAGRSTVYNIDPRKLCTPAESAPPQKSTPTPAESAPPPPQNLHPTPADLAPRTIKNPKKEPKKKRKVARGTRLPSDWVLMGKHAKAAAVINPNWSAEDIRFVGDKFRDHWISVSGVKGCKMNWDATWANWCRNEIQFWERRKGGKDAWWISDEKIMAKGVEIGIKCLPGESMYTFKSRIQAAIDNGGKPPAPAAAPTVTVLPDLPKNEGLSEVSPENRAAALAAARALKPKEVA